MTPREIARRESFWTMMFVTWALMLATMLATPLACGAQSGARVLNDDAHFPEGPVWYRGKLYYVEYDRNTVTTWDGHRNIVFATQKGCGPSAVIPTVRGDFITTCYDNGTIGRVSADGKVLKVEIMTATPGVKEEGAKFVEYWDKK